VDLDEPHVSVGGLLNQTFQDTISLKTLSIEEVHKRGSKKKKKED